MDKNLSIELKQLKSIEKGFKKASNVNMVLRMKVVQAALKGNTYDSISSCFGITIKTIKNYIKKYNSDGGVDALLDKSRSGRPPKLDKESLIELKNIIASDQERVWVARHIFTLIYATFSVIYSIKYLPELLRKLDLSFHKATHYLIKKNEEKRSAWIKQKLPVIYEQHIKEGWRIFYQDEVGFQTEGTLSHSWGPKGKDIVIKNKGRHGRVNLIGVYEVGSGEFFHRTTFQSVNSLRFKRFLCCLKRRYRNDKFIIIADNASFHKAKWFTSWWQGTNWLKMEFLPAYSPDFNPIERLWKWIKKEYLHNKCWSSKIELKKYLQTKLFEMTSNVKAYIGTMNTELLRLKAACEHYKIPFVWESLLPKTT